MRGRERGSRHWIVATASSFDRLPLPVVAPAARWCRALAAPTAFRAIAGRLRRLRLQEGRKRMQEGHAIGQHERRASIAESPPA
jgi:hypothetical protein